MEIIDLSLAKGALFSSDRKYRYALWRVWNPSKPIYLQIGLNPSTADEIRNDPTIIRGMVRAGQNGFGTFLMANLYAYVFTQPSILLGDGDFVGEYNDYYLLQMINMSNLQLCAWGSFSPVAKRAPTVLAMIKDPYCLGVNGDGQPRHPLYLSYDTPIVRYRQVEGVQKELR